MEEIEANNELMLTTPATPATTAGTEINNDKPFECTYCGKFFSFYSVLQAHERVHTGEKPFSCNICGKLFGQRGGLTIHKRRHTGERPYNCPFCDKTFASQGNMKIHERQHTGYKPYQCEQCDKTFSTIGCLKTHEITHSDLKQFNCEKCGKEFAHRTSLYSHAKRGCAKPENPDGGLVIEAKPKEKRFECRFCGKGFPYRHPMLAHERVHTGERPFKCDICDKRFSQQTSLIMHTRSHTGDRRYKCNICEKKFIQPAALNAHKRTHTGEKPFKCPLCPKVFGHATSMRTHAMSHQNPEEGSLDEELKPDIEQLLLQLTPQQTPTNSQKEQFTCFCGKQYQYLSLLEAHMRSHTGEKPFECKVPGCGKKFGQKATLQVHERTHTGEKPYSCRFCGRKFAQFGTKSVHEKSAHLGIRNYKCPTCGKSLSSPSALYTHKKTHGERTYICEEPDCGKAFALPNYLKLHVKQVHQEMDRRHVCEYCGKKFAYQGSLNVHLRTHTGEKPFQCPFCEKRFSSQGNLQSHERTHTGEKPFSCKFCQKPFAQKSQLNSHEARHAKYDGGPLKRKGGPGRRKNPDGSQSESPTGSKPTHDCVYCGKVFPYASSLYVHTRLHTGDKPFECKFCQKKFTNQGNMQVHERTHTGEKPYKCPVCDKSYAQKVGLRIHLDQCEQYLSAKNNNILNQFANGTPENETVEKKKRLEDLLQNKIFKGVSLKTRDKRKSSAVFNAENGNNTVLNKRVEETLLPSLVVQNHAIDQQMISEDRKPPTGIEAVVAKIQEQQNQYTNSAISMSIFKEEPIDEGYHMTLNEGAPLEPQDFNSIKHEDFDPPTNFPPDTNSFNQHQNDQADFAPGPSGFDEADNLNSFPGLPEGLDMQAIQKQLMEFLNSESFTNSALMGFGEEMVQADQQQQQFSDGNV